MNGSVKVKNNKGFTLVELLASIVLISIVLIFAMQLFTKVRGAYTNEKTNINYELTKSIIINAVMDDVFTKGLSDISRQENGIINFTYDDNSVKSLIVTEEGLIKYVQSDISSSSDVVRKLSDDAILSLNLTTLNSFETGIKEVIIPINSDKGVDYSIDMFFYIDESTP